VLAGGWNGWAAAVEELLRDLTPAERHAVLAGTATTFYRLSSTEN
jgi:predicted TIM-barrel fold metal-dependent hydrolase